MNLFVLQLFTAFHARLPCVSPSFSPQGRVRDLEMETQELRLALRMARDAFEQRCAALEERQAPEVKEEPEAPASPEKGGRPGCTCLFCGGGPSFYLISYWTSYWF